MAVKPMRGLAPAVQKLRRLAQRYPDRVMRAVYRRAEAIMARSKSEFVPVDNGILRNSGHVNPVMRQGRLVSVSMAYGGAAKAYAIAVHEHLSQYSPPSWRATAVRFSPAGRGPKYLERPLFEALRTMAQDIAADLRLTEAV